MKAFGKGSFVGLALLAGCSSSGGSTGPEPVITYLLQVTTAPPPSAIINSTVPIVFTLLQKTGDGPTSPANGRTITFTVTAGGGTINGSNAATITTGTDGVVSLSWVLSATLGTQTLEATATGVTPIDLSITATALPATQLAVTTQPATTVLTGSVLSRQPVVQIRNANGVPVLQSGITVTASIASGTATLGGGVTATTDANGNATFTTLSVSGSAGSVILRFTATLNGQSVSLTSDAIAVTVPPPNQLALTTAPSGVTSTVPFFQQPVVQLQDGFGVALHQAGVLVTASTGTITASLAVASGGTGSLTATTDANGVATFHDLTLTGSGSATVTFTATGFTSVSTGSLSLDNGALILDLNNGLPTIDNAGAAGSLLYYRFTAPAGTTSLSFATYDGAGNVELYARRGALPTAADFTCKDVATGNAHFCDISANQSGQWFLLVRGATTFTGNKLRGFAYGANCTPRVLTLGVAATGTLSAGGCTVNPAQRSMDRFTLTIPTPQAVTFTLSANNGIVFTIKRVTDARLYYTYPPNPLSPITEPLLLAPGTYDLDVDDTYFTTPVAPTYTFTANTVPAAPGGCKDMWATAGGLTIGLTLTANDCPGTTLGTFSHRIYVILGTGQTLTASAASTAFDPYIKVFPDQQLASAVPSVTEDDNSGGGTTARATYTNPGPLRAFTVEVSSKLPAGVGAYTFTFTVSGAYYNLMDGAAMKGGGKP